MRKASRLFEIIQILRVARRPVTAQTIAEALEVTVRSVYRDIAALQTMRVPIEGERGVGYILRPGFNLPPLMFSIEETEAIVLALAMVARTGDAELRQAARQVSDKIAASLPDPLSKTLSANALHAWGSIAPAPAGVDLATVRRAVRDEEKLEIIYRDEAGVETQRRVRPIAVIYYSETVNIVAWCELRQAIRNFRSDRVLSCDTTGSFFKLEGEKLRQLWMSGWQSNQPGNRTPERATD
ncbi:YafY family transcriptional regulator [Agrobacterium tumefaciens]|uniref:YafY family transcriptional regulator n=1 Tax=Agrobacterium tumefaciens TaxID=358 RepID=A0AAP9J5K5_AGRTU|nr:YafY family protein [Agrobacterium tumefaciens]NSZ56969.1 YafY family transcriptional regulator [Agrobacterium tumefaciens]QDY93150.1 YafY family transcriptional regulator [Agrobacterium tumefaciens]UXS48185.1 YafY family transcriptional regulator [Agrobacterium tumefaciens]UXS69506.1 YafY family transcriptional regulator [Agrobacterium tumefaciens]UXS77169.1 YafY family transcriptional regulator [Agrobacterium tumefaciens]